MAKILKIIVEPTFDADHHQARLLIGGEDMLGPEAAGLDPAMLKTELVDKGIGTVIVGRCWCGHVGCNDRKVEVTRTRSHVHWRLSRDSHVSFVAKQYDAEVSRFAEDRSWETVKVTAEREIEPLFRGTTIKGGMEFEWLAARLEKGRVLIAYRKGRRQKILKFDWDGERVADAVNRARLFRAERFPHCQ